MKVYADERRYAQESSIKIGDPVLLKQNRGDTLTPVYDPRPYAVVGVKGSMITVRRGKEIKSCNYSHCKVHKYAGKEEYDVLDLDQERRIEVEVPEEENVVVQEAHGRPVRAKTSTWETIYRDQEPITRSLHLPYKPLESTLSDEELGYSTYRGSG